METTPAAGTNLAVESSKNHYITMIALIILPVFAAAGYSLVYLLGGGGLLGAGVIFIIAKMLGK